MRKGAKLNKTKRGVEREFTNPEELALEQSNNHHHRQREVEQEEEEDVPQKLANPAAEFIEISNPNRAQASKGPIKMSSLSISAEEPGNRKEREAQAKLQAAARYQKATEEGKTDQARSDLARLTLIRKQREEAKKKKEEEAEATASKKQDSLNAGKGVSGKMGKK